MSTGSPLLTGPLWSLIQRVADEEGVELFDLDAPGEGESDGRGGILRVYITRKAGAVNVDESAESESAESESAESKAAESEAAEMPVEEQSDEDKSEAEEMELSPEGLQRTGVSFQDCVRVSKRLLDIDEERPFIPDNCMLEVSSPGVNRRLRRPEHFAGAVGERVKVKFRNEKGTHQVITGLIESVQGETFVLESEDAREHLQVRIPDVKEARVDFKFD